MLTACRGKNNLWLAAGIVAASMSISACAGRGFRFVREGEQHFLLPPGLKRAAEIDASQECPERDEVDTAALSGRGAHFGRYGCYAQTGYVDLEPGLRLRVTTPVLPEGEGLKNETVGGDVATGLTVRSNAMGWETAYYDVKGQRASSSVELIFVEGEQVIGGEREALSSPIRSKLDVPSKPVYFRLYFLSRRSIDDRDITLVASRSAISGEDSVHGRGTLASNHHI